MRLAAAAFLIGALAGASALANDTTAELAKAVASAATRARKAAH